MKTRRRSAIRAAGFLITAGVIVVVVLAACGVLGRGSDNPRGVPKDLTKVWEAYQVLKEHYVDRDALEPDRLAEGAVRGMIATLDDPFTSYFTPQRYRESLEDFEGAFQGIGAQVTMRDGKVTIVAPLPNTPADRAGLRPGDVIVAVDDKSVEGLSLEEVIGLIRGAKETPVRLHVQRPGTDETLDFRIVRAEIKTVTVTYDMVGEGIARVRITQFLAKTSDDLEQVLGRLQDDGAEAILLDLRNNPGGLLTVVVDVASEFLKEGLVLYEVNADGERTDWKVGENGLATGLPMAVLVNGGSASGSEVVAGALQDHNRAKIIGTQTFGKGVVNTPVGLSDGSGLYVTTARWFTPNGRQIGDIGVTPDIVVPRTAEDISAGRDPQMQKALKLLEQALGRQGASVRAEVQSNER